MRRRHLLRLLPLPPLLAQLPQWPLLPLRPLRPLRHCLPASARSAAGRSIIAAAAALTEAAEAAEADPASASLEGWRASFDAGHGELRLHDPLGVLRRQLPAASLDGRTRADAAEVHALPARRSFVIAFGTLAELWEVSVDPAAEPVFDGLVHDWRMGEGLGRPGFLAARRTPLPRPIGALGFDAGRALVVGRTRQAPRPGAAELVFVTLDARRVVKSIVAEGEPDSARARVQLEGGRRLLLFTRREGGPPLVVDPWRL